MNEVVEDEAKEIIKEMVSMWPQIGQYVRSHAADKHAVYQCWIAHLRDAFPDEARSILARWFLSPDLEFNKISSPIQALLADVREARARKRKPIQTKEYIEAKQTTIESNMAQTFTLLRSMPADERASRQAAILEGIK